MSLAIGAVLAGCAAPCFAQDVGLGGFSNGFRIDGANAGDLSGFSVSGAGDVNGDGLADLIIGSYGAEAGGNAFAGASYVVFGKADSTVVDLNSLAGSGFRIDGVNVEDTSGLSVSGAGDVNGDGLADLIIGAPRADPGGVIRAGSSYVVFGKADSAVVDLDNLTGNGFRIDGVSGGNYSGFGVSGAGDVNGDGLADLIIGAYRANSAAGSSYVVFGKTDGTTVDLANLGGNGFRIEGVTAGDRSGRSVSGAGDVNGDGLADLIIGAPNAGPGGATGSSYVVFGKNNTTPVDLSVLTLSGFRIDGASADDRSGISVSGAGDVNGDGLADLIIGAAEASPNGVSAAGSTYVLFGNDDVPVGNVVIDLGALDDGFRIDGLNANYRSGSTVSGAGDVNGDGLADLIVGTDTRGSNFDPGSSYVVFGKTGVGTVNLGSLSTNGYRIAGANPGDKAGVVSGAGDVNGDGLADLIVGAPSANPGMNSRAGSSYVVFSQQTAPATASYRSRVGDGDAPRTAIGTSGDGSNASHPDSRAWIDYPAGGSQFFMGLFVSASDITARLIRSAGSFPDAAATVSWELSHDRLGWGTAEVTFRYLDSELLSGNEGRLQITYSADGGAPFTPLPSVVNPLDNTVSANTSQMGFFYIGELGEEVFSDGFE